MAALLCVSLSVATVYELNQSRNLQAQLEQAQGELDKANNTRVKSPPISDETLRQLLADKEAAYTKLSDEFAQLKRASQESPQRSPDLAPVLPGNRPASGARTNSWLESIRQQDPERYKQIVDQREQRRKQADEWFQSQIARLDERAQAAPTQREVELATQIADTLAKLNDLRAQWTALRELPEDERRDASQQLQAETRDARQTLNDLRDRDRQMQLENLAHSIGYNDKNTIQGFVESVTGIYKNTEYNPGRAFGDGPGSGNTGTLGTRGVSSTQPRRPMQ